MKYKIYRVDLIFKFRRLIMTKCINVTKSKKLNMKSTFYRKLVYSLKLFELINIYISERRKSITGSCFAQHNIVPHFFKLPAISFWYGLGLDCYTTRFLFDQQIMIRN